MSCSFSCVTVTVTVAVAVALTVAVTVAVAVAVMMRAHDKGFIRRLCSMDTGRRVRARNMYLSNDKSQETNLMLSDAQCPGHSALNEDAFI
jgi:hypothetical protein